MHKDISDEALERKARSVAILKSEGVPTIDWLPVIESVETAHRRSTEEVATRAIALCLVAAKAEGLEQSPFDNALAAYQVNRNLSPREAAFVVDPHPSELERAQFLWRYECYWVLLWALGYVHELGRPDKICNVPVAVSMLVDRGRGRFIGESRMRLQSEILDQADLIYRYHWATEDARIKTQEVPRGLDSGVVLQRHHALNWLISENAFPWDDVSTDT
jgi:Domain of unknown function (DUF4272)